MEQTILNIICQSCGMPMVAVEHFGTKNDNSLSDDYCCFCFRNGQFTHDLSMKATIEKSVSYMDGYEKVDGRSLTKDEAILRMHIQLPTLKRWKTHEITHQEYFKAVNRAVNYINEHLNESIYLPDLASVSNISGFHFHRIFKALMSESPGEYIQRLRLEKAIFRLQTTKLTLGQIAEQTGYQSPQALSKAFKKRFRLSPSVFRAQPSDLPISVKFSGIYITEPQIIEIKSKEVFTLRIVDPFRKADAFVRAWKKLITFAGVSGIPNSECEYISLSRDISTITKPNLCRTYACVTAHPNKQAAGEFGKQFIHGGLYAIFTYKGAYENIEMIYCFIYRNWLPSSNYELRDMVFFEKYLNTPDIVPKDELVTEIYIPICPTSK